MKCFRKNVLALVLLIMGVVIWLSPNLVVSADTSNPVISISNPPNQDANTSGGAIADLCLTINNNIHDKGIMKSNVTAVADTDFVTYSFSSNVANITINMTEYNKLGNKAKQDLMQVALDTTYNSNVSKTNRNKIYNALCKQDEPTSALVRQLSEDVNADFAGAYKYFKPFSGPLGVVLGLLTLAIFVILGLTLVIDIAFITLPFVQSLLLNNDGKAKFVSIEAVNAVKEQESKSGSEYVNPMGIYLKSKTKQYIAIFICILYLMSGKIFSLLARFMDYFSGILG